LDRFQALAAFLWLEAILVLKEDSFNPKLVRCCCGARHTVSYCFVFGAAFVQCLRAASVPRRTQCIALDSLVTWARTVVIMVAKDFVIADCVRQVYEVYDIDPECPGANLAR
jgi:hypothetical protein